MPTAIPQVPPPPKPTEAHQPKQPARRRSEESFRDVLDGAKRRVEPKQKKIDAPAKKPVEASGADEPEPDAGAQRTGEAGKPAPKTHGKDQVNAGERNIEAPAATPQIDSQLIAPSGSVVPPEEMNESLPEDDIWLVELPAAEPSAETELEALEEPAPPGTELLPPIDIDHRQPLKGETSDTPALTTREPALQVPVVVIENQSADGTSDAPQPVTDAPRIEVPNTIASSPAVATPDAAAADVDAPSFALPQQVQPRPAQEPGKLLVEGEAAPVLQDSAASVSALDAKHENGDRPSGDPDAESGMEYESPGKAPVASFPGSIASLHGNGDAPANIPDPAEVSVVAHKPEQGAAMKLVLPPSPPVADALEARFAESNHPRIITAVQSELMPSGGTVRLRLDPPELGALQVRIDVKDGVLAASFQTSNDEATRLLTRSLQQLKTTLESHGVTVDKLHVQQTPREQWDGNRGGDDRQQQQSPQHWQQQEQQRREMLQRMWRRARDGRDPFDLVA